MVTKTEGDLGLTWKRVLLLATLAVLGAVVGQLVFDVANALTGGLVSGFLVNRLIKPIVSDFWPAFDTSMYLFRWALGACGIGLSFALALHFPAKKAVGTLLLGCAAGLVGWLLTACVADKIPILIPFIFRIILPPAFIFLVLGIALRDLRTMTPKLILGAVIGAIVGTILYMSLFGLTLGILVQFLMALQQTWFIAINPVRLIDAIFVTFTVNLLCLSLLKKRLQKRSQDPRKDKE